LVSVRRLLSRRAARGAREVTRAQADGLPPCEVPLEAVVVQHDVDRRRQVEAVMRGDDHEPVSQQADRLRQAAVL